jgi:hypothetical protein
MLRICLIIAIVAGLGTLALSQLKVKDKIDTLSSSLDETQKQLTTSRDTEQKAKKTAREMTAAAEKANKELEGTKAELETTSAKAEQQQKRADDLEVNLNKTTKEKNESQAKLAEYEAFGKTPLEIRGVLAENKKLVSERGEVDKKIQVQSRDIVALKKRLLIYEPEEAQIRAPANLKGKVIAVDPKYEFVVLDVGEKQGLPERAELLVNRSGKLVAKVRVLSVDENRAIANVLPDWKQAEIMEGDTVVAGL